MFTTTHLMISNLEAHVIVTTVLLAALGIGYFIDRSNHSSEEPCDSVHELSPPEDIPAPAVSVPETPEEQPVCSSDATQQPDYINDSLAKIETVDTPGYKRYSTDYRNELWPSPRPVNFVKALVKKDGMHVEGRLTHGKAIDILSSRAGMTPEQFLHVDPITYTKVYMPRYYNAAILLGQSIQRLEDTIRRHQYLSELRKHG